MVVTGQWVMMMKGWCFWRFITIGVALGAGWGVLRLELDFVVSHGRLSMNGGVGDDGLGEADRSDGVLVNN